MEVTTIAACIAAVGAAATGAAAWYTHYKNKPPIDRRIQMFDERPGVEATVRALNQRFAGHARVRGFPVNEPILEAAGPIDLGADLERAADEYRRPGALDFNETLAILAEEPDWHSSQPTIRYYTTDFAAVKACRDAGHKPKLLSACVVAVDAERGELLLHRRRGLAATYHGQLHVFGGSFSPTFDRAKSGGVGALGATARREFLEETEGVRIEDSAIRSAEFMLCEETSTGFVQMVFCGVVVHGRKLHGTVEGEPSPIRLTRLEQELLRADHWVPSGRLHVLAWLALGAPGAPAEILPPHQARRIFERVVSAMDDAHASA